MWGRRRGAWIVRGRVRRGIGGVEEEEIGVRGRGWTLGWRVVWGLVVVCVVGGVVGGSGVL